MNLQDQFATLSTDAVSGDRVAYTVRPIEDLQGYFLGRDNSGLCCLLVKAQDETGRRYWPAILLRNITVQFNLKCIIRDSNLEESLDVYSVIRCKTNDAGITRYFLLLCDALVRTLGPLPKLSKLFSAVNRIASIFQRLQTPPARSISGLFGELFIIWKASSAENAVALWRQDVSARFDFASDEVRLEVKTASGRVRAHHFSFDQLEPPGGAMPIIASMLVEKIGGGTELSVLIANIRNRLTGRPELILRLEEVLAETLGESLQLALSERFDIALTESTLAFYRGADVPAVRGTIPPGVTEVSFKSDLSQVPPFSIADLIREFPDAVSLLPPAIL